MSSGHCGQDLRWPSCLPNAWWLAAFALIRVIRILDNVRQEIRENITSRHLRNNSLCNIMLGRSFRDHWPRYCWRNRRERYERGYSSIVKCDLFPPLSLTSSQGTEYQAILENKRELFAPLVQGGRLLFSTYILRVYEFQVTRELQPILVNFHCLYTCYYSI